MCIRDSYNTKDAGGLLKRSDVQGFVPEELCNALPESMIYVFGRADNAVIFYGTNLIINNIQEHLLSLPAAMGYGGLFTVREDNSDGISSFDFNIYVAPEHSSAETFLSGLLDYLCRSSAEFNIKYQNLSKSAPRPLITVRLTPVSEAPVGTKHRFIV